MPEKLKTTDQLEKQKDLEEYAKLRDPILQNINFRKANFSDKKKYISQQAELFAKKTWQTAKEASDDLITAASFDENWKATQFLYKNRAENTKNKCSPIISSLKNQINAIKSSQIYISAIQKNNRNISRFGPSFWPDQEEKLIIHKCVELEHQLSTLQSAIDYCDKILTRPESVDGVRDAFTKWLSSGAQIPFISGFLEINNLINLLTVAQKAEKGKISNIDKLLLDSFSILEKYQTDYKLWTSFSVGEWTAYSVNFLIEMALTGWVTNSIRAAAVKSTKWTLRFFSESMLSKFMKKTVTNLAEKKVVAKATKEVVKKSITKVIVKVWSKAIEYTKDELIEKSFIAFGLTTFRSDLISKNVISRMLDHFTPDFNEKWEIIWLTKTQTWEKFSNAMVRWFCSTFAEFFTEQIGEDLLGLVSKTSNIANKRFLENTKKFQFGIGFLDILGKSQKFMSAFGKYIWSIGQNISSLIPNQSKNFIKDKLLWSNPFGEYFEEFVNNRLGNIIDKESPLQINTQQERETFLTCLITGQVVTIGWVTVGVLKNEKDNWSENIDIKNKYIIWQQVKVRRQRAWAWKIWYWKIESIDQNWNYYVKRIEEWITRSDIYTKKQLDEIQKKEADYDLHRYAIWQEVYIKDRDSGKLILWIITHLFEEWDYDVMPKDKMKLSFEETMGQGYRLNNKQLDEYNKKYEQNNLTSDAEKNRNSKWQKSQDISDINKSKEKRNFTREEVTNNAKLNDNNRIIKAENILWIKLDDKQKQAILDAHNSWENWVFEVTKSDLFGKIRILSEAGFAEEQRRILIESGICGSLFLINNLSDIGDIFQIAEDNYKKYMSYNDFEVIKKLPINEQEKIFNVWLKLSTTWYSLSIKNIDILANISEHEVEKLLARWPELKKVWIILKINLLEDISDFDQEDLNKFRKWVEPILTTWVNFSTRDLSKIRSLSNAQFDKCIKILIALKLSWIKDLSFLLIFRIMHIPVEEIYRISNYLKQLQNAWINISYYDIERLNWITQVGTDNIIKWHSFLQEKWIITITYSQFELFTDHDIEFAFKWSKINKLKELWIEISAGDLHDISEMDSETEKRLYDLDSSKPQEIKNFMQYLKENKICLTMVDRYRKKSWQSDRVKSWKHYLLSEDVESRIHFKKFQNIIDDLLNTERNFIGCSVFGSYTKWYADASSSDFDVVMIFDVSDYNGDKRFDFAEFENKNITFGEKIESKIGSEVHPFVIPISNKIIDNAIYNFSIGKKGGDYEDYKNTIGWLFAMRIWHSNKIIQYRNYFIQEIKKINNWKEIYENLQKSYALFNPKYPKIDFE